MEKSDIEKRNYIEKLLRNNHFYLIKDEHIDKITDYILEQKNYEENIEDLYLYKYLARIDNINDIEIALKLFYIEKYLSQ